MADDDYYSVQARAEIDQLISKINGYTDFNLGEHSAFVSETLAELKNRAKALKKDISPEEGVVEFE